MKNQPIDVIATTISGSIQDWGKVKHIIPLFEQHGFTNVQLFSVDSHAEVRRITCECLNKGHRIIISAGGSGTFNAALEGCCDSGVALGEIRLGFLRKGSADLIGKVLGMPDEIEDAIKVFAESIINNSNIACDVIKACAAGQDSGSRHFLGYGGVGIFGMIPTYTENRFIKYYKGILGQLFGDMAPFFVGACLASIEQTVKGITKWRISIDGQLVSENIYRSLIIANGDLGKNMPLAKGVPLGSGNFYLFGLRNQGLIRLPAQFKHTWDASVLNNPDKWGFEKWCISKTLRIESNGLFKANIDGSTTICHGAIEFQISDQIQLISR